MVYIMEDGEKTKCDEIVCLLFRSNNKKLFVSLTNKQNVYDEKNTQHWWYVIWKRKFVKSTKESNMKFFNCPSYPFFKNILGFFSLQQTRIYCSFLGLSYVATPTLYLLPRPFKTYLNNKKEYHAHTKTQKKKPNDTIFYIRKKICSTKQVQKVQSVFSCFL